jgi:riboflavin biosynthesis pyrimidine reductase
VRALLPNPAENADVHAHYAETWLAEGGLRVNFVESVDGAATQDGLSQALQTPGDNRVFAALRDLADIVLVGAGTARAEGYRPVRVSGQRAEARERYGLAPSLPTAVVSRSLDLGWLTEPAPGVPRTIVLTSAAADPARRAALDSVADIAVCGADEVDLRAVRAALAERGLTRVLCEGGPHLFAAAVRAGVVDEVCLSMTPMLSGPGAGRIVAGERLDAPSGLRLIGLLEEDGALFCRYVVEPKP